MLLIFDWDGTLSDSTDKIVACVQAAVREMGLRPVTDAEIRNIIGLGLPEAMAALYPEVPKLERQSLAERYARQFVAADIEPSQCYQGVEESLLALKNAGHQLAVATGKSRRGLDRVLDGFGWQSFFDASRCADETSSKPDPQMLNELTQYFGVAAHACVMVGDTEYDMAMAQAIAMPRIAVSYGAHAMERLLPYEPVLCLDYFPDLLAWSTLN